MGYRVQLEAVVIIQVGDGGGLSSEVGMERSRQNSRGLERSDQASVIDCWGWKRRAR